MKSNILDNIPNCKIDSNGVFKYIQIIVQETYDSSNVKYVVRGFKKYSYHKENYADFQSLLFLK